MLFRAAAPTPHQPRTASGDDAARARSSGGLVALGLVPERVELCGREVVHVAAGAADGLFHCAEATLEAGEGAAERHFRTLIREAGDAREREEDVAELVLDARRLTARD